MVKATALAVVVGLGALSLSADRAQADSTCSILNFTTSTACISPVPEGPGGNVTGNTLDAFGMNGAFGVTGWTEVDELKREGSPSAGSTTNSKDNIFQVTYEEPLYEQGTWTLLAPFEFDPMNFYLFVIKGATDNAAYLMDTAESHGSWFVNDLWTPNGKNNPDMSNIRLFAAPIPLPPVVFMMLGALGALVVASRRRRTA